MKSTSPLPLEIQTTYTTGLLNWVTSVFDSPQLSVSFNVQDIDGGRALVLKKVSSFAVPFQASYFTSPLSWKKKSQSNDCYWLHGPRYHCPVTCSLLTWEISKIVAIQIVTVFFKTLVGDRAAYFASFLIIFFNLPSDTRPCTDKRKSCNSWARSGYCNDRRYAVFMAINCKKTCNKC